MTDHWLWRRLPMPKRPFQSLNVVSDQHEGLLTCFFQHDRFREKCREQHKDLSICFHWSDKSLWLRTSANTGKYFLNSDTQRNISDMVRLLPDNMSASVLIDGESTENIEVRTGVKEGCVIAPRLFSIFISAGLHLVLEKFPRGKDMQFMMRIDGKLLNLRRLPTWLYLSSNMLTTLP